MSSTLFKNVLLLCVGGVMAAGYLAERIAHRPATGAQPERVQAASARPAGVSAPQGIGYGKVELRADRAGHYTATVEIDGRSIPMLVDTGATTVALRSEDAQALGRRPAPSEFTIPISTANGTVFAAPVRLPEVRLGSLRATDVAALVLKPGMTDRSLLGMSFLRKLGGFEVASGTLILKQ